VAVSTTFLKLTFYACAWALARIFVTIGLSWGFLHIIYTRSGPWMVPIESVGIKVYYTVFVLKFNLHIYIEFDKWNYENKGLTPWQKLKLGIWPYAIYTSNVKPPGYNNVLFYIVRKFLMPSDCTILAVIHQWATFEIGQNVHHLCVHRPESVDFVHFCPWEWLSKVAYTVSCKRGSFCRLFAGGGGSDVDAMSIWLYHVV
jgi:hypothetical protein